MSDIQPETTAPAEADTAPAFKLYPIKHVLWTSCLGGPLAGTWMIAANFQRLGAVKKSHLASAIGAAAVGLVVMLSYLIERRFGKAANLSLGGVLGVATFLIAKRLQGSAIEAHENQGGRLEPVWKSVGIMGIGIAQTIIGAAAIVSLLQTTVVVGSTHEIELAGMATESDARRVGAVLTDIGMFPAGQHSNMTLTREPSTWTLTFTSTKAKLETVDLATVFAPAANALRDRVFPGDDRLLLVFANQYGFSLKTCELNKERQLACR
jgi:hypothetical protein